MPSIGSQALVRLLPRTRYDLGQLRDGVVELPVAQHIDVLGYERATLQIRIYGGTVPAGASLKVALADDGFVADDPASAMLQLSTADGEPIGALDVGERTVFPLYQSISTPVPGVIGRLLAVVLSFAGGSAGGPAVEVGLDLVLTGGSVGASVHQASTYLGYAHEAVEATEVFDRYGDEEPPPPALPPGVVAALRDAIAGLGDLVADKPDGGYPRFGNVNVGIDADGIRPDVGGDRLAAVLAIAVQDALRRGGLDLATPDGGYARFGNVNIGVDGHEPVADVGSRRLQAILAEAIREAVRRGDLDLATAGGGYARFGNVNIGLERPVERPVETDG